jgi:hypothetical protein
VKVWDLQLVAGVFLPIWEMAQAQSGREAGSRFRKSMELTQAFGSEHLQRVRKQWKKNGCNGNGNIMVGWVSNLYCDLT